MTARPRRRYRPAAPEHVLVTLDPGGDRCGVAAWYVAGDHDRQGRLLGAAWLPVGEVVAWAEARAAEAAGGSVAAPARPLAWSWVVEAPHLRGDSHAQRRGVDALKRTLRRLRAAVRRGRRRWTWTAVRPSAWKANVPKPIHHLRIRRFLGIGEEILIGIGALDHEAGARGGYQPDRADAIGIGVWALGRCERGGVAPIGRPQPPQ
jgi:hypothetical protein